MDQFLCMTQGHSSKVKDGQKIVSARIFTAKLKYRKYHIYKKILDHDKRNVMTWNQSDYITEGLGYYDLDS